MRPKILTLPASGETREAFKSILEKVGFSCKYNPHGDVTCTDGKDYIMLIRENEQIS